MTTDNVELLVRVRIARDAMLAARTALDLPETQDARIELDSLIADANEAIEQLSAAKNHSHDYGEWEDDPAGVVRHCECGAVDWRPEG